MEIKIDSDIREIEIFEFQGEFENIEKIDMRFDENGNKLYMNQYILDYEKQPADYVVLEKIEDEENKYVVVGICKDLKYFGFPPKYKFYEK